MNSKEPKKKDKKNTKAQGFISSQKNKTSETEWDKANSQREQGNNNQNKLFTLFMMAHKVPTQKGSSFQAKTDQIKKHKTMF
jgi:hypothetical protein